MVVVGVDPGKPLSLALVKDGRLLATASRELVAIQKGKAWNNSPELMAAVLNRWREKVNIDAFAVELVGPMPGEGAVSAAGFVGSMWMAWGYASACCIPIHKPTPQKWKKYFGLPGGVENKDLSRGKALQLWPHRAKWFKYKYDHNKAEAALIALYIERTIK